MAKPFAGALSRRRTQVFFIVMGFWTLLMASEEKTTFEAQHFKFTSLGKRDINRGTFLRGFGGCLTDRPSSNESARDTEISTFGLMLNGEEVTATQQEWAPINGSIFLSFESPIQWNGWYFVTSTSNPPSHDPVRFALYAKEDDKWKVVGSSGYARIHVSTVFFHSPYNTSTARGAREFFDLYRLRIGSIWQSIVINFSLGLAGAAKREDLGAKIISLFYGSWALVHLIRASHYLVAAQPPGAAVYLLLFAMQLGNLLLTQCERWTLLVPWHGGMSVAVALLLRPFESNGGVSPTSFFLVPGVAFLSLAAANELRRRLVSRSSLALIATDRHAYDNLWARAAAARPDGIAALAESAQRISRSCEAGIQRRPSGIFAAAAAAAAGTSAETAAAVVRQDLPGLTGRGGRAVRGLIDDLNLLYEQVRPAARAGPVFRAEPVIPA
jgi:hypothetical protein